MSVHTQFSWPLTPTLGLPLVGGPVTHPLEPWVSRAKVHPPPSWGWSLYRWGPVAARVQQPLPPATPWGADPPISSPNPLARAGGREDQPSLSYRLEPCDQTLRGPPCLGAGITSPVPHPRDTRGHTWREAAGGQARPSLMCVDSFLTSSSPHPRSQEDAGLRVPGAAQAPLPKCGRAE